MTRRSASVLPPSPALDEEGETAPVDETADDAEAAWTGKRRKADAGDLTDDALVTAKAHLADAVEAFMDILQAPNVVREINAIDRANLAKYLTIAKLRLENAIAVVRSESPAR